MDGQDQIVILGIDLWKYGYAIKVTSENTSMSNQHSTTAINF